MPKTLRTLAGRNPLPSGAVEIGWGLVANGLATYGFLIIARRSMGDGAYGVLAVLWGLVYIAGPGLFQPLEQEVARATAERGGRGLGSAPVLRRAGVIGAGGLGAAIAAAALAWPMGLDDLLDGRVELLVALILALAAFAGAELVRGIMSGRHLFDRYGWYFAAEGGSRLAVAGILAAAGVRAVGAYALALPLAFAAGALAGRGRDRPFVRPGPPASYREVTGALGFLLVASVGEAFMLNVGPVAVGILAAAAPEAPGVFLNGLIVARIPLFFFQAVKASLLPNLADRAARGDLAGFRAVQFRLLAAVAAGAAFFAAAAALAGPWVVETAFGDRLSGRDMALMAASSGGLMVLLSLALGLVALGHVRMAAVGWAAGVAAFPPALALADEPFLRVEIALIAAVLVGSLVTAALLRLKYAAHRRVSGTGVTGRP